MSQRRQNVNSKLKNVYKKRQRIANLLTLALFFFVYVWWLYALSLTKKLFIQTMFLRKNV